MLRIIAGQHRGRRIETSDVKTLRPTSSRTRAAIFNILSHGAFSGEDNSPFLSRHVADLFCGSGALGFEALSRGAAGVTFVDQSQDALNLVRTTAERFKEMSHARLMRSDSSQLPLSSVRHSLVFIDPPYNSGLAPKSLTSLKRQGWLEKDAVCVVEVSSHETFEAPEGFSVFDEREYGNTAVFLLRAT